MFDIDWKYWIFFPLCNSWNIWVKDRSTNWYVLTLVWLWDYAIGGRDCFAEVAKQSLDPYRLCFWILTWIGQEFTDRMICIILLKYANSLEAVFSLIIRHPCYFLFLRIYISTFGAGLFIHLCINSSDT